VRCSVLQTTLMTPHCVERVFVCVAMTHTHTATHAEYILTCVVSRKCICGRASERQSVRLREREREREDRRERERERDQFR